MKSKKKIGLFLSSQAISLFGSSLVQYAIIWYITLKTGSGVMMTIATLCGLVPQVLISLFAGVWADRFNKKKLIILSDGAIAISTLIIAILFLFGIRDMWLLFIVLIVRSFGSGIQAPTVIAFIPELASGEKLMKINGIHTTIQSIMMIISPAISGALLASVNLEYLFFIDVITALIGIFLLSFVKIDFKKKIKEKVDYFKEIKEGLVYTKNHKLIFRLMIYLIIANFIVTPISILTPLYVTRIFGADPIYLTLNEIIFFVGSIVGGILISTWGGFKDKIKTISLGCVACGLFSILLGFPIHLVVYLIWMGLIGLTVPMLNTPFITIFQEHVEADKYGRVFSLVTLFSSATVPLAMLLFGPLADAIKIEYILMGSGLLLMISAYFLMKDKIIRKELKI